MAIDLSNKIALVTGGTKGIGRAIAESLVTAGAGVAITARNDDEIGSAVADLKKLGPGTVAGYVCDVRDYEQVKSVIAALYLPSIARESAAEAHPVAMVEIHWSWPYGKPLSK